MRIRLLRPAVIALFVLGAGRAPCAATAALPIFDAHLHYNGEAAAAHPVSEVLQRFRDNGVHAILATSTPNDGTRMLAASASADPAAGPRVVAFVRPYRNQADRATWFNDPASYALIESELARDVDWRGIGEFHLSGRDADTPVVKKIVALAGARGLWLHAHCDEAALRLLLHHDPRARIIWAHTGFSAKPDTIAELFAHHPNLVGELSYRDDVTTDGKLTPAWRALFLAHGDRFLVGSDTWSDERWSRYEDIIARYRGWLDQLPAAVAAMVAHANGERMFPAAAGARHRLSNAHGLLFQLDGAAAPPDLTFERLKPWALMLKLAERPSAAANGATLDQQLLDDARRRKLEIVGMELPDEQVAAFDAIALPAQVALVKFLLEQGDALAMEHDQVIAAWLDRNLSPGKEIARCRSG